jgi:hypothetical protein
MGSTVDDRSDLSSVSGSSAEQQAPFPLPHRVLPGRPPSLLQLIQLRLVSGRHILWGPVEGMVHAHMDLCDTGQFPQALARVVDKRCAHQASRLCHPDYDADARPPGL